MAASTRKGRPATPTGRAGTPSGPRAASDKILGDHPASAHPFGKVLAANDGKTGTKVPHRALTENNGQRPAAVKCLRQMLTQHHASPEAMKLGVPREPRTDVAQRIALRLRPEERVDSAAVASIVCERPKSAPRPAPSPASLQVRRTEGRPVHLGAQRDPGRAKVSS
jgi:hypothetical protein